MTSYLIISENKDDALLYAEETCGKHSISLHDMTLFDKESDENKSAKKSWGIEDVRILQKTIFLKPLRGKMKAIIVKEAEQLTIEAQNALLKVLEEPPPGTLLFLLSSSFDALLPTVISRCTIIQLRNKSEIDSEEVENIRSEIDFLKKGPISMRLKKAEVLSKNKDDAALWLKKAIHVEHTYFQQKPTNEAARTLKQLSKTLRVIKTSNANVRLTLETCFLNL